MLSIALKKLAPAPLGIYGQPGSPLPARMAFLHPAAAATFAAADAEAGGLLYSDVYRDAMSSLTAHRQKSGVQRPSYSAHGYGLAFDLAVDESIKKSGRSYPELLALWQRYGWVCYCRDGRRGSEDWHFNWLGPCADEILAQVDASNRSSWWMAAEQNILSLYPEVAERMSGQEIQEALAELGIYRGTVDGNLGPLTVSACAQFGAAWDVPSMGRVMERTLRFVSATIVAA